MSSYLQPLYDALRARILVAWPDVEAGAVWEAEHVSQISWGELDESLPYAVMVVNSLTSTDLGGMCNLAFLAQVDVYRVQRVGGPSGRLLTKLEALRDDLLTNTLAYGQVWPDPMALSWNDELTVNQILARKQSGVFVRAGRLSITVLVGDAAE